MASLKKHLDDMLQTCEGMISLEEIKEYYAKTFYVELKTQQIELIKKYLTENYQEYKYNAIRNCFETDAKKSNYLYVEDNLYFSSIEDVMKNVFGFIKVKPRTGYFRIPSIPDTYAWFPQFGNKEWENLFLNDGTIWTEMPLIQKHIDSFNPNLTNEYRFIFAHEKEGYRFTGLFQESKIIDGITRIHSFVDNKVGIISAGSTATASITTNEVDEYVKQLMSNAKVAGDSTIRISFHTIRDKFGERVRDRAPIVCNAIRNNMTVLDKIIYQSPKGNSSLFEVEFDLSDK